MAVAAAALWNAARLPLALRAPTMGERLILIYKF